MISALISGQAARVVFIQGTEIDYIDVDAPDIRIKISHDLITRVLLGASDVEQLTVAQREDVYLRVLEKYNYDRGLRMLDILCSRENSTSLRLDSAKAFLEIIESDASVFEQIKNLAFSSVNSQLPFDLEISEAVNKIPALEGFIRALVAAQAHIILFSASLEKSFDNNKVAADVREEFRALAVKRGVFRKLVETRGDKEQFNNAILAGYLALQSIPGARLIIGDWTKDFIERKTRRQLRQIEQDDEKYEAEEFSPRNDLDRNRRKLFIAARLQQQAIVAKLKTGEVDAARRFAHQLINSQLQNGGVEYAAKSLTVLANEARKLGQISIELEWALQATNLAPDDGFTYGLLADTYLALYRFKEAEEAFQKAIVNGEEEFGQVGLARILKANGRLEEALIAFEKARSKFQYGMTPQYSWLGYCETLRDLGHLDLAFAEYEKTTQKFPNEKAAFNGKASVLVDLGRLTEAEGVFEFAKKKFPSDPVAYCGLAGCFKEGGDFSRALKEFDEAIAKFPDSWMAVCGRADVFRSKGEFEIALTCYENAKKRFPFEPSAFCGYADTYRDLGDSSNAIRYYEEAVTRFPLDARTRAGFANVLKSARKYDAALQAFDSNIRDFPQYFFNRLGRANMLKQLGRYNESLSAFEILRKEHPGHPFVLNGTAAVLVALRRHHEALKILPRDNPRTESEWVAYHIRGMCFIGLQQYENAEKLFIKGLHDVPFFSQRAVFRQALALTQMKQSKFHLATTVLVRDEEPFEKLLLAHCFCKLEDFQNARNLINAVNDNAPPALLRFRTELAAQFGINPGRPQYDEQWLFGQEAELILQAA